MKEIVTQLLHTAKDLEEAHRLAKADLTGIRVAVMIGKRFHDAETVYPIGYLVNRGANPVVIGTEPGEIQAYNSSLRVNVQHAVTDVALSEFDALILPGGEGPQELRKNENAVEFAGNFLHTGRPVAAICHGPQVLITADVLENRTVTGVEDIREELEEAGAEYRDREVVVYDNLLTSRTPDDLAAFSTTIVEMLNNLSAYNRGEVL